MLIFFIFEPIFTAFQKYLEQQWCNFKITPGAKISEKKPKTMV